MSHSESSSEEESNVQENVNYEDESQNDEMPQNDEERLKIRNELASMSFEDLQKLKETMGSKLLEETLFGKPNKQPRTDFKRANKNRPVEASSKIKPKKIKLNKGPKVKSERVRITDPRFDPLCGNFDKKEFKQNYKFLKDVRKNERKQLQEEYSKCQDPKQKETIRLMLQRLNNQIRENEKTDVKEKREKAEKQEIKEKLKRGEKPIFKKKSEKKIEDLIHKYEDLKKSNKLQKHIEKRSKKLTGKDKKKLDLS